VKMWAGHEKPVKRRKLCCMFVVVGMGRVFLPSARFNAPSNGQETRACHCLLFEIILSLLAKKNHEKHLAPNHSCKFNINSAVE